MKLDPTLSGTAELVYGTYYGGGGVTVATNGTLDLGNGVVAVGGDTTSATTGATAPDVPLANAYQSTNLGAATGLGETGFLVVMDTSSTGMASLLCSTYFGGSSGSDEVHAMTYDAGDPTAFRIILRGPNEFADKFSNAECAAVLSGCPRRLRSFIESAASGAELPYQPVLFEPHRRRCRCFEWHGERTDRGSRSGRESHDLCGWPDDFRELFWKFDSAGASQRIPDQLHELRGRAAAARCSGVLDPASAGGYAAVHRDHAYERNHRRVWYAAI